MGGRGKGRGRGGEGGVTLKDVDRMPISTIREEIYKEKEEVIVSCTGYEMHSKTDSNWLFIYQSIWLIK